VNVLKLHLQATVSTLLERSKRLGPDQDAMAKDQVALIQQHLQHEAEAFQRGNYSDPTSLHGADMPRLKDLQAGAAHIRASYLSLPTGAEITFETTDLHLLTAIHRWFGAQLSEHRADATSE
jgi:hypothetical protein